MKEAVTRLTQYLMTRLAAHHTTLLTSAILALAGGQPLSEEVRQSHYAVLTADLRPEHVLTSDPGPEQCDTRLPQTDLSAGLSASIHLICTVTFRLLLVTCSTLSTLW